MRGGIRAVSSALRLISLFRCAIPLFDFPPCSTLFDHVFDSLLSSPPSRTDLKALQARWHPDKFLQKFSARLRERDRDAVLLRVTATAAAVNALRHEQETAGAGAGGATP